MRQMKLFNLPAPAQFRRDDRRPGRQIYSDLNDEDRGNIEIFARAALLQCGGWICAVEAAKVITEMRRDTGRPMKMYSYRPVAFALRRLVDRGIAEERVVTYKGKHRTKEDRREYRIRGGEASLFPTPKPAPPSAPRRVHRMEG